MFSTFYPVVNLISIHSVLLILAWNIHPYTFLYNNLFCFNNFHLSSRTSLFAFYLDI